MKDTELLSRVGQEDAHELTCRRISSPYWTTC